MRAKMASLLDDVDFFPDISVVEHLRMLAWLHGADGPERRVLDLWLATRLNEEKSLGVAVVFASHDSELVEAVADRTIQLVS